MKVFSRRLWIGALLLISLCTSCNLPAQTPTPAGTILPVTQVISTALPAATASLETPSAEIPVTGMDEVSMQCQFCVNDEPHAVLVLPERVSFLVSDPVVGINCITAQIVNEKRILFCRGPQQTTFTLNVCAENSNCNQYSITLETCPQNPKTVTINATPIVLTPINSSAAATLPAGTLVPTQAISSPPPVAASTTPLPTASLPPVLATTSPLPTVALPTQTAAPTATTTAHVPQSRGTPQPSTRLPRTGLFDPEGFLRWYFDAVWKERNYQDLWENYLTLSFKTRTGSSNFEDYAGWWNTVDRVDVNSVNVLQNDGTHAWVRVNVTFHMVDGRVISNQEYDYDLLFDATRQTWMFDYRP